MAATNISVSTKGWADRINTAWRNSAAEIVNTGRILLHAKAATRHGDFERMLKAQLDFSPQTARKLMAVAGDERVLKLAHGRALPDHWTTLYELTKLDDDQFEQALNAGTIRPDMERKDVPRKRKESPAVGSGNAVSAESSGETPPFAAAFGTTPHDDREGGDSIVTEHGDSGEHSLPIERSEPERLFDPASGTPQSIADPERVAFLVRGSDSISMLANGLAMAIMAIRDKRFSPAAAVEQFPQEMVPWVPANDVTKLLQWMYRFEKLYRDRCGDNAAPEAAE